MAKVIYGQQNPGTRKSVVRDYYFGARPTGRRRSRTGNYYYEYRENRTDIKGTRL